MTKAPERSGAFFMSDVLLFEVDNQAPSVRPWLLARSTSGVMGRGPQ